MFDHKYLVTTSFLVLQLIFITASAKSIVQQWQQNLKGAQLTHYSGSVISTNSSLTVINFCSNGRYNYNKDASWNSSNAAGASNRTISGRWEVKQGTNSVIAIFSPDQRQQLIYPIYLQNNGRVNIGGTAFATQRGGAGC